MISRHLQEVLQGKDQLILMDLSWHLYRNFHAMNRLKVDINGYQRPTGHIYGTLKTVQSLVTRYKNAAVIVCQDGIPISRQEAAVNSGIEYKEGRPELEFNMFNDIPLIEAAVYMIPGCYWAYNFDRESDDIMYALAKQSMKVYNGNTVIFSGDNDLLQAIGNRVYVTRGFDGRHNLILIDRDVVVNDDKFKKKFLGCPPEALPIFRAIVGDPSDNVKAVYPRFPRRIAYDIAMWCEKLEDIKEWNPLTDNEKIHYKDLLDNFDKLKSNYSIMKLSDEIDVNIYKKRVNKSSVFSQMEKLKLNSFIQWVEGGSN